ncbi:MAG: hypothetical protein KGI90_07915 [Burkholderiales bacterium]|nr:hypothetical protein [Burkholderiales bacterium]MDE2276987.1 hypothetical protein [Burkholderiales bacterium]
MPFAQLSTVRHRVQLGSPLPFHVRDVNRQLLLARGQIVASQAQLEALCERGAVIDLADLQSARDEIMKAPREQLPRLWSGCIQQVSRTLRHACGAGFRQALTEATEPVQTLVERDPDLAIFQVLCQGHNEDAAYGAQRSMQTAIAAMLVAQRLGWEASQCERLFKVALTMNLSMLELQGQLARQRTAPTEQQRRDLQSHPERSVLILEQAGIVDGDWLQAVLRHHEQEDGSGYPAGCTDVGELAALARRVDVYTAKLSARSTRDALAADVAGRQMFMQDPGHPMTAALVKEFGIFPPGCYVRLASGELAIVVQRGPTITTPMVARLTNERGMPLPTPERMQTTDRAHAVEAVVGERSLNVRLPPDRLAALMTA